MKIRGAKIVIESLLCEVDEKTLQIRKLTIPFIPSSPDSDFLKRYAHFVQPALTGAVFKRIK